MKLKQYLYEAQNASLLKRYSELKDKAVKFDHHVNVNIIHNWVDANVSNRYDLENTIEFDSNEDRDKWYKEFLEVIKKSDFLKAYNKPGYWN